MYIFCLLFFMCSHMNSSSIADLQRDIVNLTWHGLSAEFQQTFSSQEYKDYLRAHSHLDESRSYVRGEITDQEFFNFLLRRPFAVDDISPEMVFYAMHLRDSYDHLIKKVDFVDDKRQKVYIKRQAQVKKNFLKELSL